MSWIDQAPSFVIERWEMQLSFFYLSSGWRISESAVSAIAIAIAALGLAGALAA